MVEAKHNVNAHSEFTEDIFDRDYDKGTITSRKAKVRALLLAAPAFAIMQEELYRVFSTGASIILMNFGRPYGKNLAISEKRYTDNPVNILNSLTRLAATAGWGRVTLAGDKVYEDHLRVVVRNCVFCEYVEKRGTPSCYFLAGVIAGIAEELYGDQTRVSEEKCISKGDDHCEFLVQRVDAGMDDLK